MRCARRLALCVALVLAGFAAGIFLWNWIGLDRLTAAGAAG
jgi:hypothetical protein